MTNTKQELATILDGAPSGATHFDGDIYMKRDKRKWWWKSDRIWYEASDTDNPRSLSDIQRIIKLENNLLNGATMKIKMTGEEIRRLAEYALGVVIESSKCKETYEIESNVKVDGKKVNFYVSCSECPEEGGLTLGDKL